ncbi:hypothetical protein Glove_326g139 [Diversispora epigaea]|uniref:Uncharacterized protein n=1 Tax=Diversispora epigaea TaxID=1348612 RepID=A0A397HLW6_9GLOM|nr:hypothetical protein Glove_326g139 [Diversispora epigaea]
MDNQNCSIQKKKKKTENKFMLSKSNLVKFRDIIKETYTPALTNPGILPFPIFHSPISIKKKSDVHMLALIIKEKE